jgi:phosphopantothenoylcysteine decarboxylase/phosphopantothenate--cysteine ligase
MARLLLGVTGGIAAYKSLELVRLATAAGHAVRVLQTPRSQQFVGAASFAALSGAPVLVDEFERDPARGAFPNRGDRAERDLRRANSPDGSFAPINHLALVANADVYLVAPATANTIAKLAHGLADNLVATAALAATCPVVVAPAMNHHMWEHAATRANVATLRERGVTVLEPGTGRLASKGEWGSGRLPEPAELLAAVEALVPASGPLEGLRVLVTAGGTREPIDAVRFVGNRSSGRMGFALAEEAAARGAEVTVIAANVALSRHPRIHYVDVESAAELQAAAEEAFEGCDVLLMAAAVADFRPSDPAAEKLKKEGRDGLSLSLEPTDDVLRALAARRRSGQTLVGFAAEAGGDAIGEARRKLHDKGVDAIVLNDVSRSDAGFDVETNEVTIVSAGGERHVPLAAKEEIAAAVLDAVGALRDTVAA